MRNNYKYNVRRLCDGIRNIYFDYFAQKFCRMKKYNYICSAKVLQQYINDDIQ